MLFWAHLTQSATAISSFRQFAHFSLHVNQCSNITMAERKEFDLFAYIFNRDGEEDQTPTEPEEEDSPLVDLTVDRFVFAQSKHHLQQEQSFTRSNWTRCSRRQQIAQKPVYLWPNLSWLFSSTLKWNMHSDIIAATSLTGKLTVPRDRWQKQIAKTKMNRQNVTFPAWDWLVKRGFFLSPSFRWTFVRFQL